MMPLLAMMSLPNSLGGSQQIQHSKKMGPSDKMIETHQTRVWLVPPLEVPWRVSSPSPAKVAVIYERSFSVVASCLSNLLPCEIRQGQSGPVFHQPIFWFHNGWFYHSNSFSRISEAKVFSRPANIHTLNWRCLGLNPRPFASKAYGSIRPSLGLSLFSVGVVSIENSFLNSFLLLIKPLQSPRRHNHQ